MKLIRHDKIGEPQRMTLDVSTFVVFLTKHDELRIERGDRLIEVARVVALAWDVQPTVARQIVALWFALGARLAKGNPDRGWTTGELSTHKERRYLKPRLPDGA